MYSVHGMQGMADGQGMQGMQGMQQQYGMQGMHPLMAHEAVSNQHMMYSQRGPAGAMYMPQVSCACAVHLDACAAAAPRCRLSRPAVALL